MAQPTQTAITGSRSQMNSPITTARMAKTIQISLTKVSGKPGQRAPARRVSHN